MSKTPERISIKVDPGELIRLAAGDLKIITYDTVTIKVTIEVDDQQPNLDHKLVAAGGALRTYHAVRAALADMVRRMSR